MIGLPTSPSPTWRTFLGNQLEGIAVIDMFVLVTAAFRLLDAASLSLQLKAKH